MKLEPTSEVTPGSHFLLNLATGRAGHATLSAKGEQQAARLGEYFKTHGLAEFDAIFSSTSTRAKQTAKIVCSTLGISPEIVKETDELLEQCHGGWEGRLREEVYTPEVKAALEANYWQYRPEGLSPEGLESESQQQVEQRIHRFVEEHVLKKPPGYDRTEPFRVAVFGHGYAVKSPPCDSLLQSVDEIFPSRSHAVFSSHVSQGRSLSYGSSYQPQTRLDNTGITEVHYDVAPGSRGGWQLIRVNDHAHLR